MLPRNGEVKIMTNEVKQAVTEKLKKRYERASRKEKSKILDELCNMCDFHRKHAIRLLNPKLTKSKSINRKRGAPKQYDDPQIIEILMLIREKLNLPCSRRLKAALPSWLPFYEQYSGVHLSSQISQKLLKISAASIDRLLKKHRRPAEKLGLCTTKPGTILKKHIPILTDQWDERRPGYMEADTVAHCGTSVAGSFVYTLNIVDIATGWHEQRALWEKGYRGVLNAITDIEHTLPFRLRGFDCDNGNEFLNWHLFRMFENRKQKVQFTRSRPYRKNDNAHIEEKNWTVVRQYIGYERFDHPQLADSLNEIYTSEWRLFMNFFVPSSKLMDKQRVGGKITKKYDKSKTPYERIMNMPEITNKTKNELTKLYKSLNPFVLHSKMMNKIKIFHQQKRGLNDHF
jgi:hypothetical protein